MPSPFPGMDPYLEDPAWWPDFHAGFLFCWRETINALLPDSYDARIDERVRLEIKNPDEVRTILPDVAVTRGPTRTFGGGGGGGVATLPEIEIEPVVLPLPIYEEVRERRVEITHLPDRRLVAVLELLSPTNKAGEGAVEYRAKRSAVITQRVHLVELDLLVGGERLRMRDPLPPADYYAIVSRADRRPNSEVYAWPVGRRLPTIPIPLLAPDPDVRVNLADVFQLTYDRGRYARVVDYRQPPAALAGDDAAWAAQTAGGR